MYGTRGRIGLITLASDTGASPPYVWDLGSLTFNDSGLVTITATLDPAITSEYTFSNTALITTANEANLTDNRAEAIFEINLPPTADAGGPYLVDEGGTLTLDASGSTDPGDPITPTAITALIQHPKGLFKNRPARAEAIAFLNQADAVEHAEVGKTVSDGLSRQPETAPNMLVVGQALKSPGVISIYRT